MKQILTKAIILISALLLFNGCMESDADNGQLTLKGQRIFCSNNPNDLFCSDAPSIGDLQPSKDYAMGMGYEIGRNIDYEYMLEWFYNDTVHEYLKGDCTNIALTIIKHMTDEGIDKKYLYLAYKRIDENSTHMFVAVDTPDGIIHVDNGGKNGLLVGDNIDFYMPMTSVGVNGWIKGNIE